MDFTKFDVTKLFDVSAAIDSMEKGADTMLTYVPEQFKKPVVEFNRAGFELARAQADAFAKFGSAVQKATKIAA
jgi:hypothetical protein